MQHQYIQNLQKANMTLKCKIKDMMDRDPSTLNSLFDNDDGSSSEGDVNESILVEDDDFEITEVGTIEEVSSRHEKHLKKYFDYGHYQNYHLYFDGKYRRGFYDDYYGGEQKKKYQTKTY